MQVIYTYGFNVFVNINKKNRNVKKKSFTMR